MAIARYLAKLAQGLSPQGVVSAAKGGTGTTNGSAPTISAISYPGNDTAVDIAGGQTVTLTGTNFAAGAKVLINQTQISVVTFVSSTELTFITPALVAGSYILYVVNADGSTAIAVPGIQYSGVPSWTTFAGTLGTQVESTAISTTVSATSNSTVSYSLQSGTLPTGAIINSSSGTITGTSPLVASPTTYTFTVRATDAENQDTDRIFSLTINPDVVTWASSNTVALSQNTASTTTLSATSASGQAVSYSTNTLPTGLSLVGNVVSGTPTVTGETITTAIATAAVTGKTAQQTITWTVSIASDINWRYTTLLLNAETTAVPFATDASTNNFPLTVAGDTRPNNFNPYQAGYYSNYWDGTGDSLTVTGDGSVVNFGTADFTIEAWIYAANLSSGFLILDTCPAGVVSPTNRIYFDVTSTGTIRYVTFQGATVLITSGAGAVAAAQWTHVALVKSSSQTKLYVNGTQVGSTYTDTLTYPSQLNRPILCANGYDGSTATTGYISNFRIVKGTAVYTANFTPPTTPLTAISGTSLLTCQSNRLVDLSTNAYTMTKTGDVAVSVFQPFTPSATYATYGSTYFDGTGDYISVPNNSVFNFGTGDFTVEFWIFCTSAWTSMTNPGIAGQKTGDGTNGWQIYRNGTTATDKMNVRLAASGDFPSTVAPGINTWEHWALVRNGTTLTWYKDGVAAGSYTGVNANITDAGIFYIGYTQTWGGYFGGGYLSNIRVVKGTAVYTGAFTPPTQPLTAVTNTQLLTCQTNQPSNNSQFINNSTLSGVVTRFGNTTQGTFSPYGANWSGYFPANGSYLTGSNAAFNISATNTVWTYESWVMPSTAGHFFAIGSGSAYGNSVTVSWNLGTANKFRVNGANGASLLVNFESTGTYPAEVWYHVAVTRTSAGVYTLYINGLADGTQTYNAATLATGTTFVINGVNDNVGLGNNGGSFYASNVRFVSGSTVYTSNFTPSTQPLTPIAGTVLLTCQSPSFVDNGPNAIVITKTVNVSAQKFSPFSTVTQTPQTYSTYFTLATDQRYTVPVNTAFAYGTGDFTVEGWFLAPTMTQPNYGGMLFTQSTSGQNYFVVTVDASAGGAASGKIAFTGGSGGGTAILNGSNSYTAGTWNHFAVCRVSGMITVYLNGQGGTPTSNTFNYSDLTYVPTIGGYTHTSANNFSGYISNLRVVKGTAIYTANFTPPTQPLTAISGTSLLTCQSTTIRDNSANAFTTTIVTASPRPSKQNPFGFTTSAIQEYSPAEFGGSMYFDNSGDYLALPTLNTYLIGPANFTIECWVYKRSTTFDAILSYGSGSGMRIFVNASGGLELWVGASQQWTFPAIVLSNQWNHVAFVRTGTTITGYVNGVNVATAAISTDYNAGTLNIGGEGTGSPWGGYISDLRITKGQALYTSNFVPPQTPLTAGTNATVLINGDKSAIADKTGKVILETVGDARTSTVQKKYGTASMSFDGTGDNLSVPNNALFNFGTGAFTVEAWVYFNSLSGSQTIVTNYGGSTTGWAIQIISGVYSINLSGDGVDITGPSAAANTWTHVAVSGSSGSIKLFINGTQQGSTFTGAVALDTTAALTVGSLTGLNYLNGYIDDLRITKGFARYTTNFTPPSSTLLVK